MNNFIVLACILLLFSSAYADDWQTEDVDILTGQQCYSVSMAIQADDIVHIAYNQLIPDTKSELRYTYWSGAGWSSSTVVDNSSSSSLASSVSLALDSSNNPGIAFNDNCSGGSVRYSSWTGTEWLTEDIDNGDYFGEVSLCISNNEPSIAYSKSTGSVYDVMYARYDNQWLTSLVTSQGPLGHFLSMAVAGDGSSHIAYFQGPSAFNLKYALMEVETWETTTVDNGTVVGFYNSIAVDSNNNPHISYFDFYNDDLKYACYDGSNWMTEVVDGSGLAGDYCTSIALDSSDQPHISYYHGTHDCLMHACYNGAEWIHTVVDESDDAGKQSSIIIDSNDMPHIAYSVIDGDNTVLRHAYLTPEGIEGEGQTEAVALNIFPNPCSGTATVSFSMPAEGNVTLSLYDVSGRLVTTIADETFSEAAHSLNINGLSPGIYICALQTGELTTAETLVVIE